MEAAYFAAFICNESLYVIHPLNVYLSSKKMTYQERKQLRTEQHKAKLGRKTGSLEELEAVRLFYKTEAPEAQDAEAEEKAERDYFEIWGSVNKYYVDEG